MKMSRRLVLAAAALVPLAAWAHPGHDGDHDITWDFGHLVSHPLATLAGATVIGVAAWGVWRLLKPAPTGKIRAARRDRR